MIFKKKIARNRLYKEYVTLFNGFHGLSERELDVFANLVKIDYKIRTGQPLQNNIKNKENIINTHNRKIIMKETLINKNNLSRYISNLKKTKALVTDNNVDWRVNDSVMKPLFYNDKSVSLIFTFEIDE